MKKIAILGASGYIGKSLVYEFLRTKTKAHLYLFSRSKETLKKSFSTIPKGAQMSFSTLATFAKGEYDVVINCTGIRDPAASKKDLITIYTVTEEIDNLIIGYCIKNTKTKYINISSGAVYGNTHGKPITEDSVTSIAMNELTASDHYAIAKINAEAKHRALSHLSIIDLRMFSFFSRTIDTSVPFLMSDVVSCVLHKKILQTSSDDIMRDYVCPADLFQCVNLSMTKKIGNNFFDVISLKPISKLELLSSLQDRYGLRYQVIKRTSVGTRTTKHKYYSINKRAMTTLGYKPKYSSLSGIIEELDNLIKPL